MKKKFSKKNCCNITTVNKTDFYEISIKYHLDAKMINFSIDEKPRKRKKKYAT